MIIRAFIDFQTFGKRKENIILHYFIMKAIADKRPLIKHPKLFLENPKLRNKLYKTRIELETYEMTVIKDVADTSVIPIIRLQFGNGYVGIVSK